MMKLKLYLIAYIFTTLQNINIGVCQPILLQSDRPSYPEIGKPCPDFILTNIKYYRKNSISLNELRNKWIILDFWSEYCTGCISSFPKMNSLKEEFEDKVEFFLVGLPRKNPMTIRSLYERCKIQKNLTLPLVIDSSLGQRFGAEGLPLIIIIDPNGVVRGITSHLEKADLAEFISGGTPAVSRNYLRNEKKPVDNYNFDLALFKNNNDETESNYTYHTMLTKWTSAIPTGNYLKKDRFELLGMNLDQLFMIAYLGKDYWGVDDSLFYGVVYPKPILEVKDSSKLNSYEKTNKNLYCYSITYPTDSSIIENEFPIVLNKYQTLQKRMQYDLESFFGFTAFTETRQVQYFKLIANEKTKRTLRTKGGPPSAEEHNGPKQGRSLINVPIRTIASLLYLSLDCPITNYSIIDATGIEGNIDLTINGTYYKDYIAELKKAGLELIPSKKEMRVLVIKNK